MKRARSRAGRPIHRSQDDRPIRTQETVLAGVLVEHEEPVDAPLLTPEHADSKRRWALSIHDQAVGENLHHLLALWSRPAAPGDRFCFTASGTIERLPELALAA